jgi:hypothetical protein
VGRLLRTTSTGRFVPRLWADVTADTPPPALIDDAQIRNCARHAK